MTDYTDYQKTRIAELEADLVNAEEAMRIAKQVKEAAVHELAKAEGKVNGIKGVLEVYQRKVEETNENPQKPTEAESELLERLQ